MRLVAITFLLFLKSLPLIGMELGNTEHSNKWVCPTLSNDDLKNNIKSLESGAGHMFVIHGQPPYEIASVSSAHDLNDIPLKQWIFREDNGGIYQPMIGKQDGNICVYHEHLSAGAHFVDSNGHPRPSMTSVEFTLKLKPQPKSLLQRSGEEVKRLHHEGKISDENLEKLPSDVKADVKEKL